MGRATSRTSASFPTGSRPARGLDTQIAALGLLGGGLVWQASWPPFKATSRRSPDELLGAALASRGSRGPADTALA
jgi:hypothetical protein